MDNVLPVLPYSASELAQLGVQSVTQPVTEKVEGENRDEDGQSRKEGQMIGNSNEASAGREHGTPFWSRRLSPEADEAQACGRQYRGTKSHREVEDAAR